MAQLPTIKLQKGKNPAEHVVVNLPVAVPPGEPGYKQYVEDMQTRAFWEERGYRTVVGETRGDDGPAPDPLAAIAAEAEKGKK